MSHFISTHCPSQLQCQVNFCHLLPSNYPPIYPYVSELSLPINSMSHKHKISLKKITRSKPLTKRTSKPLKHWEETTHSNTHRLTENHFTQHSQHLVDKEHHPQNTQPIRRSLNSQTYLPNNHPNANILKRRAIRSTEFLPITHTVFDHQKLGPNQVHEHLVESLHMALKQTAPQTQPIIKSLTQRHFIPNLSSKIINTSTKSPSLLLPIPVIASIKHSSPQKFISGSNVARYLQQSKRQDRDFQKQYETVNSVFSESAIDERVSESTVEIDFFHPSRGKIVGAVERF